MKEEITLLQYSNTNTYLIEGERGAILFDTGWAGTFPAFCAELGRLGKKLNDIDHLVISHFHPDHYGIAQEIADKGPVILACDVQKEYLHASDMIFEKDKRMQFYPIREEKVKMITLAESRRVLAELGIDGELLHTPGHSDDSISLWLDKGDLFVGDLNPLYELELHKGTEIGTSWERLLALKPKTVYYGHAKTAVLAVSEDGEVSPVGSQTKAGRADVSDDPEKDFDHSKWYELVSDIIKYIDKGWHMDRIAKKTGADPVFIEDVTRMYLTHTDVGVQGILDRIEIKNK
ncbi:MAG: MBL fold metallo-hydrolase [Lachnospiraceae bacterium]|nr:MBL fold metallo-hydrolase [Lachnospiraceae bacterium]